MMLSVCNVNWLSSLIYIVVLFLLMLVLSGRIVEVIGWVMLRLFCVILSVIGSVVYDDVVENVIVSVLMMLWKN